MNRLFLVKDKKSRISGPYEEEEIARLIEEGSLTGEEMIASYPSGDWKPLAAEPALYEKLVSVFQGEEPKEEEAADFSELSQQEDFIEPTVIIPEPKKKKKRKKRIHIKFKDPNEEEEPDEESVIEMEEEEEEEAEESRVRILKKAARRPLLVLIALAAFFFFYQALKKPAEDGGERFRVRLTGPERKSAPLKPEVFKQRAAAAEAVYLKGDLSGCLKAQSRFVSILEGRPDFLEGYKHLCLIYLELGPFADQDTKDHDVFQSISAVLSETDKSGGFAGFCRGSEEFFKGRYRKSKEIADGFLERTDLSQNLSPFFYYLKAKALNKMGRSDDALHALRGARRLFDGAWTAPLALSAEIHYKRGEWPQAIKFFQNILKISPRHQEAGLALGVSEYKYLKRPGRAGKRLSFFLNKLSGFVNTEILKEAYMTMAEISEAQKNKPAALKYMKKAYMFEPSNEKINGFLTRLGGEKPGKDQVKTRQLIYKGDLLTDQGNCQKAKVLYKEAFEIDNQTNSLAAVRMAQCFWKEGIAGQAFHWMKQALSADPKRVESYFLLADYYSAQYGFDEAKDILAAAGRQVPNSYEIFKGYALTALRQKNYRSAVHYGERARELYSSDIETDLILSRAYRGLGRVNKEAESGRRAVKAAPNDTEAQINMALVQNSTRGFFRGERRLNDLIEKFPLVTEYRQALGEYYFEHENFDKAKEAFQAVLLQDPDFKPAHIFLGRVHAADLTGGAGEEEAAKTAKQHLLQAAVLDPSDPEPLFQLGLVSLQTKLYVDAEAHFERTASVNSRYPFIHYYIGKANFLQGDRENIERALAAVKIESKKNPNLAAAYTLAGDIYSHKARSSAFSKTAFQRRAFYEMCVKEYQKALRIRQKDVDIYVKLMTCYNGAGELDSALQLASQAVKAQGTSGYPELYEQLGIIYERKGDIEQARKAYEEFFILRPGAPNKEKIMRRLNVGPSAAGKTKKK